MNLRQFKNLFRKSLKHKVLRDLINNYEYQVETNKVLESWITEKILAGQTGRRQELEKKQQEIKEMESFLQFLREIKKRA